MKKYQLVSVNSNRQFGFLFACIFLVLSLLPLLKQYPIQIYYLLTSITLLLLTLFLPSSLKYPNFLWLKFGELLHKIVSPVVLFLIFYLVITPTGLIMKLFGKDPLMKKWDKKVKSYFISRTTPNPQQMKKPY